MNFDVVLTKRAHREFKAAAAWMKANRTQSVASRWLREFALAIESLKQNPQRCARAREKDSFPIELRALHFGLGRRKSHRAVFAIRPDRVIIYSIRHVAQRDLTPDDL